MKTEKDFKKDFEELLKKYDASLYSHYENGEKLYCISSPHFEFGGQEIKNVLDFPQPF
jgi:hypothetical protein